MRPADSLSKPAAASEEAPAPAGLLSGLTFVVDVAIDGGAIDGSAWYRTRLQALGAKTVPKVGLGVSALLFKDGNITTYDRAQALGIRVLPVGFLTMVSDCDYGAEEAAILLQTMPQVKRPSPPAAGAAAGRARDMAPKPIRELISPDDSSSQRFPETSRTLLRAGARGAVSGAGAEPMEEGEEEEGEEEEMEELAAPLGTVVHEEAAVGGTEPDEDDTAGGEESLEAEFPDVEEEGVVTTAEAGEEEEDEAAPEPMEEDRDSTAAPRPSPSGGMDKAPNPNSAAALKAYLTKHRQPLPAKTGLAPLRAAVAAVRELLGRSIGSPIAQRGSGSGSSGSAPKGSGSAGGASDSRSATRSSGARGTKKSATTPEEKGGEVAPRRSRAAAKSPAVGGKRNAAPAKGKADKAAEEEVEKPSKRSRGKEKAGKEAPPSDSAAGKRSSADKPTGAKAPSASSAAKPKPGSAGAGVKGGVKAGAKGGVKGGVKVQQVAFSLSYDIALWQTCYAAAVHLGASFLPCNDEISSHTVSHLVTTAETRNTFKLLLATARGAAVVRYEWVLRSLEADEWLDPSGFLARAALPDPGRLELT